MSTRATMAYRLPDGGWQGVYQHSDGYPSSSGSPYALPVRMRAYLAGHTVDEFRALVDATPQGFSYFEPTGAAAGARSQPYGAYEPGDMPMQDRGTARELSGMNGYLYVVEPDGSVTETGGY